MIWKHGRRLRGPELVTTSELNGKLGKSSLLRVSMLDGIAFVNEEASWWIKTFINLLATGHVSCATGGDALPDRGRLWHRQIGNDSAVPRAIADRGEAAKVYDPAMKYLLLSVWLRTVFDSEFAR